MLVKILFHIDNIILLEINFDSHELQEKKLEAVKYQLFYFNYSTWNKSIKM